MINGEREDGFEHILAVENQLMRPEQAKYYMAWHRLFGDQRRVVDNAMGPNLSSDLLLTNATEIIAVDEKGFYNSRSHQYVDEYWHFLDTKPIYRAGAFGYRQVSAENLELPEKEWRLFFEHQAERWRRGYWDMGALNHWDIDRLLFLEMKKMGVERRSIRIATPTTAVTKIRFEWAYPGEGLKQRTLIYLTGVLDQLVKTKAAGLFRNIDGYMQKGLETDSTFGYIREMLPRMSPGAIFAIGYIFKAYGDNREYGERLGDVLGRCFVPQEIEAAMEKMIDDLPDEDDGYEAIRRGIKLHVFKRK